MSLISRIILGGRFEYFLFFCSGRGNGGVRGARTGGGGYRSLLKAPGWGEVFLEGPRGREVSAVNWGILGAGAKYFFSGPKHPPRIVVFFRAGAKLQFSKLAFDHSGGLTKSQLGPSAGPGNSVK